MSFLQTCKQIYLTHFSKPVAERVLYRNLKRQSIKRILEVGVGDLNRSKRILKFASELADEETKISFTGIDMFEGRDDDSGVPLKEAHRALKQFAQTVKLIPGDPYSALARSANSLQQTDMIIISADQDRDSLDRAWFYVPRMMHDDTLVFLEVAPEDEEEEATLELISMADVVAMARAQDSSIRRAA